MQIPISFVRLKMILKENTTVGEFEQYTKGIGNKLLRKWGWYPSRGLGKKENGIVNPIIPQKREKYQGLSAKDDATGQGSIDVLPNNQNSKRKASKEGERRVKKLKQINEPIDLEAEYQRLEKWKVEREKIEREIKQRALEDMEIRIKTAEAERSALIIKERIVDKIQKIDTHAKNTLFKYINFKNINRTETIEYKNEEKPSLVIVLDEEQPQQKIEEERMVVFDKILFDSLGIFEKSPVDELEIIGPELERSNENNPVKRFEYVEDLISVCIGWAYRNSLDFKTVRNIFNFLADNFSQEYKSAQLEILAFVLVTPIIYEKVSKWNLDNILDLSQYQSIDDMRDEIEILIDEAIEWKAFLSPQINFKTHSYWSLIMERIIVQPITTWVEEKWKPNQNDSTCIELLSCFYDFLNMEAFIDGYVSSTIKKEIAKWDPKEENAKKLDFLHLWLKANLINEEDIATNIHNKVSCLFQTSLSLVDEQTKEILTSLHDLSILLFDLLSENYINPNLHLYLRENLKLDKTNQDFQTLVNILSWRGLLRESDIIELFEVEFFPQWLQFLYDWLETAEQDKKTCEEVLSWYQSWKKFFGESEFFYPSIVLEFDRALHLISVMMK